MSKVREFKAWHAFDGEWAIDPTLNKEIVATLVEKSAYDELAKQIEDYKNGVQNFKCPACDALAGPLVPINLMTEYNQLLEQANKFAEEVQAVRKYLSEKEMSDTNCAVTNTLGKALADFNKFKGEK